MKTKVLAGKLETKTDISARHDYVWIILAGTSADASADTSADLFGDILLMQLERLRTIYTVAE